jgi:hypothetical protein
LALFALKLHERQLTNNQSPGGRETVLGGECDDKTDKVVSGLEPKAGPGSPPKHAQFPKGTSGNPKGRPKGSRNLRTVLLEAADHPVTAEIGGKQRKLSALEATAFRLAEKAANGAAKNCCVPRLG